MGRTRESVAPQGQVEDEDYDDSFFHDAYAEDNGSEVMIWRMKSRAGSLAELFGGISAIIY